jgi:hypothetical protein
MKQNHIFTQAIKIATGERPAQGNYPQDSFQSSSMVTESFFLKDEMDRQEEVLVSKDMPFIYTTSLELLKAQNGHIVSAVDEEEPAGDIKSKVMIFQR